jgi:hypothetical protein
MATQRQRKYKVTVRFRRRDDGALRAYCSEVPGFFLASADKRALMRDVIPALELLIKRNFNVDARVSPLGYGIYELVESTQIDPSEIVPDMPEYQLEYVVEKIAA